MSMPMPEQEIPNATMAPPTPVANPRTPPDWSRKRRARPPACTMEVYSGGRSNRVFSRFVISIARRLDTLFRNHTQ